MYYFCYNIISRYFRYIFKVVSPQSHPLMEEHLIAKLNIMSEKGDRKQLLRIELKGFIKYLEN